VFTVSPHNTHRHIRILWDSHWIKDRQTAVASTCTIHDIQKKRNSMPSGKIRTRNPSMRAASSLCPGPCCHQDQLKHYSWYVNTLYSVYLKCPSLHLSGTAVFLSSVKRCIYRGMGGPFGQYRIRTAYNHSARLLNTVFAVNSATHYRCFPRRTEGNQIYHLPRQSFSMLRSNLMFSTISE